MKVRIGISNPHSLLLSFLLSFRILIKKIPRHKHLYAPPPLLTIRLVSDVQRSPTDTAIRRFPYPMASASYLLPFIIGAELLDQ